MLYSFLKNSHIEYGEIFFEALLLMQIQYIRFIRPGILNFVIFQAYAKRKYSSLKLFSGRLRNEHALVHHNSFTFPYTCRKSYPHTRPLSNYIIVLLLNVPSLIFRRCPGMCICFFTFPIFHYVYTQHVSGFCDRVTFLTFEIIFKSLSS